VGRRRGFVGRREELGQLEAALGAALDGRGRVVLLAGEPGIGKTRVTQELAARAQECGALILGGRCHDDEGAPAYWPWMQIIRAYVQDGTIPALATESTPGAIDVLQLGSGIGGRVPEVPIAPSPESAQARFRLFDSVTTFFKNAASHRPLVLVLDDLHSADSPSLLLLAFLAREISDARLLVLGTYRDSEVAPPLAEMLAEVVREPHASRLHLRGLSEPDVGALIEIITGMHPEASLVRRLHGESEGNPFFVGELVRLLATEGRLAEATEEPPRPLGLPEGVRAVIGRRLEGLSEECRHVLAAAAVIGRDFGVPPLEPVAGLTRERLLAVLGEAVEAFLIVEERSALGRFRFAHALIRETLYRGLNTVDRVRLHRRVAESLELLYGANPEEHLTELAHHFFEAAPGGDVERAVAYAEQAGVRALHSLAYEEAAAHCSRALEALELMGTADEGWRCDLLLALAEAQTWAGSAAAGEETYLRAAAIARALGDPARLARAALGYGGWAEAMGANERMRALLEEAERALGDREDGLRAKVLARLAAAVLLTASPERRIALCDEAVAIARQTADDRTLLLVLSARHFALWGPDNLDERIADANEILRLAGRTSDREYTLAGHFHRMMDLMELGDIPAADREIEQVARLAEELRAPFFLEAVAITRATRARLEGRYEAAEKFAQQALAIGQRTGHPLAGAFYGVHAVMMARDRGGLENWAAPFKDLDDQFPIFNKSWRCLLAWLYAEIGHHDEARREIDRLAANDFAGLPGRDNTWLSSVTSVAEAVADLRDAGRASVLYGLLHPYAGRNVVFLSVVYVGSASHALGRLAVTMGRWDTALRHFDAALMMNTRMGARTLVAHTQHVYGTTLLAGGTEGDRDRGRALLAQALATAQELGMTRLAEKILAAGRETSTGGVASDTPPPPAFTHPDRTAADALFRREGDYWTIRFEGRLLRLHHTLGLAHLAQLLRHPGREFLALDLASAADGRPGDEGYIDISAGGSQLDAKALAAYRRRLEALREQLDEAMASADSVRTGALRSEMDFLTNELARAVGLGGHTRPAGSPAERARINVTRTVKDALRRVAAADSALGRHLAATVRTGTYCVYVPDPRAPIFWKQ
jgi:tetratricopeptide (TPR) repeat protein